MAMAASALHRTGAFVAPLVALVVVVSCGDTGGEGAQVIAPPTTSVAPASTSSAAPTATQATAATGDSISGARFAAMLGEASDRSFAESTASIAISSEISGVRITGEGVLNIATGEQSMEYDLPDGTRFGMVNAGSDLFVRLPDLPLGVDWVSIGPESADLADEIFGTDLASSLVNTDDPFGLDDEPMEYAGVVALGPDTVRAGPATRYHAVLGESTGGARSLFQATADVWIDDAGRLVRVLVEATQPEGSPDRGEFTELDIEVYDFGTPIDIQPPVDGVVALADLLDMNIIGLSPEMHDSLAIGDCFNDYQDATTDCALPHDNEVFSLVQHPAGTAVGFPGDEELSGLADELCLESYEGYVGTSYDRSELWAMFYWPSQLGWEQGQRTIVCAVTADPGQLEGSVKGSGR